MERTATGIGEFFMHDLEDLKVDIGDMVLPLSPSQDTKNKIENSLPEFKIEVKNPESILQIELKEGRFGESTTSFDNSANQFSKLEEDSEKEDDKPKVVIKDGKLFFKCFWCDYKSISNSRLNTHISVVHEGNKPYKCFICNFATGHSCSLKIHVDAVHRGKKPFECSICDFKTAHKTALANHVSEVHETVKQYRFKCSNCEKTFKKEIQLRTHNAFEHEDGGIHGDGVGKPFPCKICGERFSFKSLLVTHGFTVHNLKRFKRKVEEKIMPQMKKNCQKAVKIEKMEFCVNEKGTLELKNGSEFKCSVCYTTFGKKEGLTKHVKYVHGEKKQHECPICKESFNQKMQLTKHIVFVHEKDHGGKPHFCNMCNERFTFRSQLIKHRLSTHTSKDKDF